MRSIMTIGRWVLLASLLCCFILVASIIFLRHRQIRAGPKEFASSLRELIFLYTRADRRERLLYREAIRRVRGGVADAYDYQTVVFCKDSWGAPREAAACAREAIRLFPRHLALYRLLARIYVNLGNTAAATAVMQEYPEKGWRYHKALGEFFEEQGDLEQSYSRYENALAFLRDEVRQDKDLLADLSRTSSSASRDEALSTVSRTLSESERERALLESHTEELAKILGRIRP